MKSVPSSPVHSNPDVFKAVANTKSIDPNVKKGFNPNDIVDVLGLIGQLLDKITSGEPPSREPEKPQETGYRTYEPPGRMNDWMVA